MIKRIAELVWILAGVALIAFLVAAILFINQIPALLSTQMDATRSLIQIELDATRGDALELLDKQLTGARQDVGTRIDHATAALDNRTAQLQGDLTRVVDRRASDVTEALVTSITGLRFDLAPTLASAQATFDATQGVILDVRPQVDGFLTAAQEAGSETAQASHQLHMAVPGILATVEKVGNNSEAATAKDIELHEQAIGLMKNLREDTKPASVVAKFAVNATIGLLHFFF
jgi:hypothetical protein